MSLDFEDNGLAFYLHVLFIIQKKKNILFKDRIP